ncbi:MAG TPA: response regulator [Frankiaceae bacterium]|nr:response regulator [Frankiaceae bacterium]
MSGEPVQILLVEDSPGDVNLTREALRGAKIANELNVVGDGEAALAYLRQEGEHADSPRPHLVLLDLNLPRMDGRDVLAAMKADPLLKSIPVVVLTTSSAEVDVLKAYELHANSYVTKPVSFDEFITALRALEGFWLEIVRLPSR